MIVNGLTPTQSRMWEIIQDGRFHRSDEIHSCLSDELGDIANIKPHICLLRKKIPRGYLILAHRNGGGKVGYQLVRSINSANNGRT